MGDDFVDVDFVRCDVCGYVNCFSLSGICQICEIREADFDGSGFLWERR